MASAGVEGFLCPLCMHDCRSVQELESHYRTEHDESSRSGTSKVKKFFVQVGNSLKLESSPRQKRGEGGSARKAELGGRSIGSDDGAVAQSPVTNVSGIDPLEWDPQEMGRVSTYSIEFRRTRDAHLADITVDTNRLVIRLEKLFRMLNETAPKTAKQMKSMEQNIVPWKRDKEDKRCGGCGQTFGLRRRRHHCRLCGEIRCKECCRFKTYVDTYPLLQGCPDYQDLAPPEAIPKKKFNLKRPKKEASSEDDDDMSDEVRMCVRCKKLLERRLFQLGSPEKSMFVALYEKMTLTMDETEKLKPDFLEVARVIWSGDPGPTLEEASIQRQNLLRVYESVDVASKRILSMGSSDPSPLQQKLARNIRVFASNYLQQHLLTLPSLPTKAQLQEIKDRLEREAEERLKEIERQRKEQQRLREEERQRNAAKSTTDTADDKSKREYFSEGFDKFTSNMDRLFSVNTLKDIGKEIKSIVPGEGEEEQRRTLHEEQNHRTEEKSGLAAGFRKFTSDTVNTIKALGKESRRSGEEEGRRQEGGWKIDSQKVIHSIDLDESDPFAVQREQLLSYIAQAREAKRFDEVQALECSLQEIERVMRERHLSHGFS